MNRMVALFWEKVIEFQGALENPTAVISARGDDKKVAKVIPLFK